ncbi:MAG: SDR family oxidoreductase [Pseudomonadales bacterium]|nr:SDR family oxidoreductase [Pseudomonadales bacterium]
MNFKDKIVLVTGSNRGIGNEVVQALLQRGAKKIYAASRNPDSQPAISDSRVIPLKLDITDSDQIQNAVSIAQDIDILFNNAGIAAFTSLLDGPEDLLRRDMETNYFGTLNMIRAFVPVLEQKEQASIINVVTIGAFVNFPVLGGYCASKAAGFSMSQGIRTELKHKGISVHTINPGPIDTDMAKDFDAEKTAPAVAVENALSALESGELDVFPDAGSQQMIAVWKDNYLALEAMVANM